MCVTPWKAIEVVYKFFLAVVDRNDEERDDDLYEESQNITQATLAGKVTTLEMFLMRRYTSVPMS